MNIGFTGNYIVSVAACIACDDYYLGFYRKCAQVDTNILQDIVDLLFCVEC